MIETDKKINEILITLEIHTRMLTDLLEQLSSIQSSKNNAQKMVKSQVELLANLLSSTGKDPTKFKENFSFMFDEKE